MKYVYIIVRYSRSYDEPIDGFECVCETEAIAKAEIEDLKPSYVPGSFTWQVHKIPYLKEIP